MNNDMGHKSSYQQFISMPYQVQTNYDFLKLLNSHFLTQVDRTIPLTSRINVNNPHDIYTHLNSSLKIISLNIRQISPNKSTIA
jgi:hypothetical protein